MGMLKREQRNVTILVTVFFPELNTNKKGVYIFGSFKKIYNLATERVNLEIRYTCQRAVESATSMCVGYLEG